MSGLARTLALGALATLAAHLLLPATAGAGPRATLVALPLLVAMLTALRRQLGGRPTRGVERVLFALWLAAALWGGRLSLPGMESAWFAAGVVLLGARCAALLAPLRRAMERRGARAWLLVAAVAFTLGFAVLPWVAASSAPLGDEPYYLLLAESLASDGDVDLADEYREGVAERHFGRRIGPQPADPEGSRGESFSRHQSTLPLLLSPFWAVGGLFGARLAMLGIWALTAGAIHRLLVAFELPGRAVFRAGLASILAPPLALYAHAVWVEVPAALAAACALELWVRSRRAATPLSGRRLIAFLVALAALPLLKLRLLAIALPIAALSLVGPRARRGARFVPLAVVTVATAAVLLANLRLAGSALRTYSVADLAFFDIALQSYLLALAGLFFDAAFGLLAWGPLWLPALPGVARRLVRDRSFAWAAAAFVPYLLLVASRAEWFGGWSPPFRYGVVLLPLLAVGLGDSWRAPLRPLAARLAWGLGAVSALTLLATLVEPGRVTSLAAGRSRLIDLASAPFAADLARFFPSAVRPRTATWLVPLVALVVVGLATIGRRAARPRAAFEGLTLPLIVGALVVVAAHELPTRVVEAEDPWVQKRGGALYPSRWKTGRTRFEGGWILAAGNRLRLQPVSGGAQVVGQVRFRPLGPRRAPVLLVLLADEQEVARWLVEPDDGWREERFSAAGWQADSTLGLRARLAGSDRRSGVVLIDRIELAWR